MKRWLVKIAVLLVLGAIVNVAVAWGCCLWTDWSQGDTQIDEDFAAAIWCEAYPDRGVPSVTPGGRVFGAEILHVVVHNPGADDAITTILRSGWPRYSMWGCVWDLERAETRDSIFVYRGTALTRIARKGIRPEAIPTYPDWSGSIVNTIFYAGILWPVFAAPGLIRRHSRIKRGLCPACAYPVGASDVCTECGKRLLTR